MYRFLHASLLEGALPSLPTVKRFAESFVTFPLCESGFLHGRFNALDHWLQRIGCDTRIVFCCTDATAILPRVRYRCADDAIIGAAILDDELPTTDIRAGTSVDDLLAHLKQYGLATQADVYLLSTLDPSKPVFYLAFFAQKNGPSADVLCRRWQVIEHELMRRNIYLLGTGADGGGANITAQKRHMKVSIARSLACLLACLLAFHSTIH